MIFVVSNSSILETKNIKWLKVCEISFFNFQIKLNDFENIIFTSKNGVKSLEFNKISPNFNGKVFCIGEATFLEAKNFGFSNLYLAKNSHGNEFADEILPFLKNKTLFIKALQNASNIGEILLKNGVNLQIINGYENLNLKLEISQKPPTNSKILFTSPKNLENFINNFGWDETYKAFAIGKTTAKALQNFTNPIICKTQNLKECIEFTQNFKI